MGGVGSGGRVGGGGGGKGRFERRSEIFVKIQKRLMGGQVGGSGWGRVGGVRVDVNEELKFL